MCYLVVRPHFPLLRCCLRRRYLHPEKTARFILTVSAPCRWRMGGGLCASDSRLLASFYARGDRWGFFSGWEGQLVPGDGRRDDGIGKVGSGGRCGTRLWNAVHSRRTRAAR